MTADNVAAVPDDGRDETEAQRLARNWAELLSELRVTQTGSQILTGFLLTIPFQQRFTDLTDGQRVIYLTLVCCAALATLTALAPVSLHRVLFRQGAKPQIVRITNVLLAFTLLFVALTLSGTTLLIFSVVAGLAAGIIASTVSAVLCVTAWLALPAFARSRRLLATLGEDPGERPKR
ncbi:MAG TPA: DUF6328 family protein [Pseudolysinimonas sp.]|nr:DUF6328 family protein [Pseudolysinimonas sp.]